MRGLHTRREFLVTSAGASLLFVNACGSSGEPAAGAPTTPVGNSQDTTYYANPGDTRAASTVVNGRRATFFGPKNADGELLRIRHATLESADNDPNKQMFHDFAENGDLVRASLATGETLELVWSSRTRAIITYRSADGSQEVRYPYDFTPSQPPAAPASAPRAELSPARKEALERAALDRLRADRLGRVRQAQTNAASAVGEIEVRCGDNALIAGAKVTGELQTSPQTGTDVRSPLEFTETGLQGLFEYTLPIAAAPKPQATSHRAAILRALDYLCTLDTFSSLLGLGVSEAACGALALSPVGPLGGVTCAALVAALGVYCNAKDVMSATGAVVDLFSTEYFVTAIATHPKFGTKQTRFQVRSGQLIPRTPLTFEGKAVIATITTVPIDPPVGDDYVITVTTECAAEGYTLLVTVSGTDGYSNPGVPTPLSHTVREATLAIPGSTIAGTKDTITATLTGPTSDQKAGSITF